MFVSDRVFVGDGIGFAGEAHRCFLDSLVFHRVCIGVCQSSGVDIAIHFEY